MKQTAEYCNCVSIFQNFLNYIVKLLYTFNIIVFNISVYIVVDTQQIVTSRIHEQYIAGCKEHAQYIERLHS